MPELRLSFNANYLAFAETDVLEVARAQSNVDEEIGLDLSADLLARAIREVQKGNTFFSPSIANRLRSLSLNSPDGCRSLKKKGALTSRELEVLQLIAEGKANKQIARGLGISIKTVEKHRQHVMSKLDLHDTAGVTRYAIAAGIIESSVQVTII